MDIETVVLKYTFSLDILYSVANVPQIHASSWSQKILEQ